MSLRLLLILTILFGGGAVVVSQLIVRPHIEDLANARTKAVMEYQREKSAHERTSAALKESQTRLAAVEKSLQETTTQFAAATTKAREQEHQAKMLDQELAATKQTLSSAQANLAAWESLDVPDNQVKRVIAEVKKLRVANAALDEELQIFKRELKRVTARIGDVIPNADPSLPTGLKGRVLAVDPKYDFVVLDIGAAQGAEERGTVLVNRNSKLVAKAKITRVQQNRSIANILPNWKFDQVTEGDLVIAQ